MSVDFTIYKIGTGQICSSGNSDCPELLVKPDEYLLIGVKTANPAGQYIKAGVLTPMPERPSLDHVFDYFAEVWVDPRTRTALQELAHAKVNTWRDGQETEGFVFEHAGRMWDCNPAAKDKLQSTASMDALPPGFFWTDASEPVNEDVPMDIEAVRALNEAHKLAYFQRGLQIHVRQREMKNALTGMDVEQLAAFVPGWPEDV